MASRTLTRRWWLSNRGNESLKVTVRAPNPSKETPMGALKSFMWHHMKRWSPDFKTIWSGHVAPHRDTLRIRKGGEANQHSGRDSRSGHGATRNPFSGANKRSLCRPKFNELIVWLINCLLKWLFNLINYRKTILTCDLWIMIYILHQQDKVTIRIQSKSCLRRIFFDKFLEEEGSRSNRPELAAFLLALCDTLIEEPLLYLCDSQLLLKAVNRWIGEGGKATLVGAPDADILTAAIEILRTRIAAGTATFLVKVKTASRRTSEWGSRHSCW